MKMYADYIKEREGRECIYNEYAFLTYKVYLETNEVSVYDMYTTSEKRAGFALKNIIKEFLNKMKELGVEKAYGFTDMTTKGWEKSESMMLKYGFEKLKTEDNEYNHYILNLKGKYNG